MNLLISTYDNSHFSVAVGNEKIKKSQIVKKPFRQSELLLEEIDRLYEKETLTGIIVVRGPGAFSGLRIGIATANALSYAYKILLVGVELKKSWQKLSPEKLLEKVWFDGIEKLKTKKDKKRLNFVLPFYDQEPNINKKKKLKISK